MTTFTLLNEKSTWPISDKALVNLILKEYENAVDNYQLDCMMGGEFTSWIWETNLQGALDEVEKLLTLQNVELDDVMEFAENTYKDPRGFPSEEYQSLQVLSGEMSIPIDND